MNRPGVISLADFEKRFPDKSRVDLLEVQKYLEERLNTEVPMEHVEAFLEAKGYNISGKDSSKSYQEQASEIYRNAILGPWFKYRYGDSDLYGNSNDPAYKHNRTLLEAYAKHQDEAILERLILNNLGLVYKVANYFHKMPNQVLDFDDLVSEGIIGLIVAIRKFDHSLGNSLSSYAIYWIAKHIWDATITKGTSIRIPHYLRERIQKIKKAEQQYLTRGVPIDKDSICKELKIRPEDYDHAKKVELQMIYVSSIDQEVSDDSSTRIGDLLRTDMPRSLGSPPPEYMDPSVLTVIDSITEELRSAIEEKLTPQEQEVIRRRFGFDDYEPSSLAEIGRHFNLTRERIRQIEAKALGKLRADFERRKDDLHFPDPFEKRW